MSKAASRERDQGISAGRFRRCSYSNRGANSREVRQRKRAGVRRRIHLGILEARIHGVERVQAVGWKAGKEMIKIYFQISTRIIINKIEREICAGNRLDI